MKKNIIEFFLIKLKLFFLKFIIQPELVFPIKLIADIVLNFGVSKNYLDILDKSLSWNSIYLGNSETKNYHSNINVGNQLKNQAQIHLPSSNLQGEKFG